MKSILGIFLCVVFSVTVNAQQEDYDVVSLCDLELDRTATSLNAKQLETVFPATEGFIWDAEDNETLNFRTQGITDITLDCRKYIGVTWYGRSTQNWQNRGVKISLANISDMNAISYTHVLLVDENYNTFHNMHGGGMHYLDGNLYVPDSRAGSNKRIYEFDLDTIMEVPEEDLDEFYGYKYIVKKSNTYFTPIQPTCISYDWDTNEFIVATFKYSCIGCVYNEETTFSWFDKETVSPSSPFQLNFFDRVQGIVSMDNPTNTAEKLVWVSQSYGKNYPSHLYATTFNRYPNDTQGQRVNVDDLDYEVFELPPGLEDLHFEKTKDVLWSLTEFGPNEGALNNRLVFSFNFENVLPPNIKDVDDRVIADTEPLKVYPNPNSGSFFIDSKWETDANLKVIDELGRVVYQESILFGISQFTLDLSSGVYLVVTESNDKVAYSKIIVD